MKHDRTPFLEAAAAGASAGSQPSPEPAPDAEVSAAEKPPTEAFDSAQEAEERIDQFMEMCLVPLAIRTRAVVICDALSTQNILSVSFNRISAIMCHKFGVLPPRSKRACVA